MRQSQLNRTIKYLLDKIDFYVGGGEATALVTKLSAGFFHFLHLADSRISPSCGENEASLSFNFQQGNDQK